MRGRGRGGRKKGEGLHAKYELVRLHTVRCGLCPVPRVPKGIIINKTPSLNSKLLPPPSEKSVISK